MAEMEPKRKDSLQEKDVKAPTIFERAKEEIEAAFHHDKSPHHHKETHGRSGDIDEETSADEVKAPNIFDRAKEEIEAVFHHDKSPHHYKETHGRSDDIDEETSADEVKAPGVFERVKEEIEAVVEAIHPKKESGTRDLPPKSDA
ncbi:hypothetical protein E2542_SST14243 [Spatholobus suberectus]|nr:hypothetical protein E2542_SST14243 [Spatholobus suberectus]